VKKQTFEKNVETDIEEMIAAVYFKIRTSKNIIDLLTETTHYIR